MTIFLVLDVLLVALICLFMPIGWWRGPVKELYVSLGILFGVLLADYWARPWGHDLSDMTDLTSGSGSFIVAWAFLVASTFILGYGIGATLYPAWHASPARLLGAAIGAVNGMLLLSFSLQYVRLFLLSDSNEESLNDSYMAQFLLDDIGWVVLLVAFIALPLLLFLLIDGRRAYVPDYDEYDDDYDAEVDYVPVAVPARQRVRTAQASSTTLPPRVPGAPGTDEAPVVYKADAPQRRRTPTAETRPLVVTEPQATSEPAATATASSSERLSDTDPHIVIPAQSDQAAQAATPKAQPAAEVANDAPATEGGLSAGYTRCSNCRFVLGPDISICPNCGTLK